MPDLHTKIKEIENDKKSLIMALKILQLDYENSCTSCTEFHKTEIKTVPERKTDAEDLQTIGRFRGKIEYMEDYLKPLI